MSAWKTMESAPKDGTLVLAWEDDAYIPDSFKYAVVRWMQDSWVREGDDYLLNVQPTHWCELPAPPQSSESNARIMAGPHEVGPYPVLANAPKETHASTETQDQSYEAWKGLGKTKPGSVTD